MYIRKNRTIKDLRFVAAKRFGFSLQLFLFFGKILSELEGERRKQKGERRNIMKTYEKWDQSFKLQRRLGKILTFASNSIQSSL